MSACLTSAFRFLDLGVLLLCLCDRRESGVVGVNRWKQDASKMVRHMRYCTNMEKGDPNMADIAMNCKKEVRCKKAACGSCVLALYSYMRAAQVDGNASRYATAQLLKICNIS